MKILVADDSKTNLALITDSLQKLGHEVMPASSGQQAIDLFQKVRPDLIILDVVMEGMDGFECAKRIRAFGMEDWIPIIFLSASVDDESVAKGIDAGGDDYITKPFSEITLSAKIKAMQRIAEMRNSLYDATKKLALLSSTDTLTGVYNRLQFNKTIREKIAESDRQQTMLALLFLDLDKFKEVNDVLGHHIGDLLLMEVSNRLQSCLRLHDFLCRMGGDEFAIILNNIEKKEVAAIVAQKIIQILSEPYLLDDNEVHCSCSIGIVLFPEDGLSQETLTQRADIAMYHAKNLGRNNFQFYNNTLSADKSLKSKELLKSAQKTRQLEHKTVLICLINNTRIGINIEYIEKNVPLPELNQLPQSPSFVVGLMNLGGKSVPVIDLGKRLQIERVSSYSLNTPVLLCSAGKQQAGFIVDKVNGLYEIDPSDLKKDASNEARSYFLATITIDGELTLIVNIPYLLSIDFLKEINEEGNG